MYTVNYFLLLRGKKSKNHLLLLMTRPGVSNLLQTLPLEQKYPRQKEGDVSKMFDAIFKNV